MLSKPSDDEESSVTCGEMNSEYNVEEWENMVDDLENWKIFIQGCVECREVRKISDSTSVIY